MQVQLTRNATRNIIRYIRDDGTITWMYSDDFFIRHDLSHYALESKLGYTTAFNGMINAGMGIRDFEDREKRLSMQVTAEAWYAENMANLFLMEIAQGTFDDFNATQQSTFRSFNKELPLITITDEQANEVRGYLRSLLTQWNALPEGKTLELIFNT